MLYRCNFLVYSGVVYEFLQGLEYNGCNYNIRTAMELRVCLMQLGAKCAGNKNSKELACQELWDSSTLSADLVHSWE